MLRGISLLISFRGQRKMTYVLYIPWDDFWMLLRLYLRRLLHSLAMAWIVKTLMPFFYRKVSLTHVGNVWNIFTHLWVTKTKTFATMYLSNGTYWKEIIQRTLDRICSTVAEDHRRIILLDPENILFSFLCFSTINDFHSNAIMLSYFITGTRRIST